MIVFLVYLAVATVLGGIATALPWGPTAGVLILIASACMAAGLMEVD